MNVDTHFHIFEKNQISASNSRYLVDYSATIENWYRVANSHGITGGVIIQPSFLGFNNSLLLNAIKKDPEHLRGVGVVDPKTTLIELAKLKGLGLRGIRLNFADDPNPLATIKINESLICNAKDLGMHLQIHHDDGLLNQLLTALPKGITLVIDHFGRPKADNEFQISSEGVEHHRDNLWIKLSAPYRSPNINHQSLFEFWLGKVGASRLLWGSDWPHTRFESKESYESQINRFYSLIDSPQLRHQILSENPRSLYWT